MERTARVSADGLYRYELGRRWANGGPTVTWIMLNPSTADDRVEDATLRACIGFSRRWEMAGLTVVNLFAYRARMPKEMLAAEALGIDIVGPENDDVLRSAASRAALTIVGWGVSVPPRLLWPRRRFIADNFPPVMALDLCQDGNPRHPLYLSRSLEPFPWPKRVKLRRVDPSTTVET